MILFGLILAFADHVYLLRKKITLIYITIDFDQIHLFTVWS